MSNKQIIENFYRAFAANDIEGMLSCYHDKIQFEVHIGLQNSILVKLEEK